MTQPQVQPRSGIPAAVPGVTGGQGLPQGVASVEGSTGNVVITPPSNAIQQRKGDIPQAFQVYEFFHSNTDNVRIALATTTGGPEFIGVQTFPSTVLRDLIVGTSGNLRLNAGNADQWIINGVSGELDPTSVNQIIGSVANHPVNIRSQIFTMFTSGGALGPGLMTQAGVPLNAVGNNGDFNFNPLGGALTTIYQKRAGVWVGIV